jgi:heptosyltransferase-2
MKERPDMPANPPRILLFRNGSIGNTLVAIPAIRAIRQTFPEAHLSLILDSTGAALLKNCPLIDEIIVYEKRGEHRGLLPNLSLIVELRKRHPTHAVLFKRFFRNGFLAFLSGAKERIGFETNGSAPFLNRTIPYQDDRDIVELNLQLAFLLGADKSASRELELWFDKETETIAQEYRNRNNLSDRSYAAICLSGVTSPPDYLAAKQWQEIITRLGNFTDRLVFLGAGNEKHLADNIASSLSGDPLLAFDLPILVIADMIRHARLFAGTDSGPAHIAHAVRTPGIVFFRPEKDVALEIEKWCPKGAHYRPFVPPTNPSEMQLFLHQLDNAIIEILQ